MVDNDDLMMDLETFLWNGMLRLADDEDDDLEFSIQQIDMGLSGCWWLKSDTGHWKREEEIATFVFILPNSLLRDGGLEFGFLNFARSMASKRNDQ